MRNDTLLFLDFDGVICDSLNETLVSSWTAYHRFVLHDTPSAVPAGFKSLFSRYRPFIRTGEDYLLIQHLMHHGQAVLNQEEFDARKREAGEKTVSEYKVMMNQARRDLMGKDFDFWLALNPLFPPIGAALREKPCHPRIHILSTKKKEYIRIILSAHRIEMLDENIIVSGKQNKLDLISGRLENAQERRARFIDDQIDHLKASRDARIEVFLASWGYVKDTWLHNQDNIPVISLENAVSIIEEM